MFAVVLLIAQEAGVISIPKPTVANQGRYLLDDFPNEAFLGRARGGVVAYKAVIRPVGKPDSCVITYSSLSERDSQGICSTIKSRFRYQKVQGPSGEAVYYVLEGRSVYAIPGSSMPLPVPIPLPQDGGVRQAVVLKSLPPLAASLPGVVNVFVDAEGNLMRYDMPPDARVPALSKAACEHLAEAWKPMPEKNAAGVSISYIRQISVAFREAP